MMDIQQSNPQPRILGPYQLLHRLAQGPEGEIWQAHKTHSQRQMIIRLLPPIPASARPYLHQFNQIMQTVMTLKHAHILPVYDFGAMATSRDEISCYLVLPFIEGFTTLQARLQATGTPLPPEVSLRYLRQAAQALDFAHSRQVLHLGLTPATILLNGDILMLTDFGLASLFNIQPSRSSASLTNPYRAPEQMMRPNQPATMMVASDVYSLAMISYRLLAGHLPLQEETGSSQMAESLLLRLAQPALSPEVENIHTKALSNKPGERYSSCSIFVQALERAWKGLPLAPEHDPEKTLVAPWSRQRLEQEIADMATSIKPAELEQMLSNAMHPLIKPPIPDYVVNAATPPYTPPPTPNQTEGTASPTYIKPSIPEQIENASSSTYIRPALENASSSTYVRPPIPEQLASSLLHPQSKIGRRALIIGGAAAAVVLVGGGTTLAVTATHKGSPTKSSLPNVNPVHFTPGRAIASLTGHTGAITNVAWSPDGRYLVSAATLDKFAMLWDLSTVLHQPSSQLQILKQPTREWNVYPFGLDPDQLRWTPDGRSLLTITSDCPTLLDAFSSTGKPRIYSDQAIKKDLLLFSCPIISRQNATLAAIDGSLHRYHKIDLWHLNTFTTPYTSLTYTDANQFIGDSSTMNTIAWSPDSTQIAGITTLNEVVVWNIKSHTPDAVIKLPDVVKDEADAQVFRITITWSPINPHLLAVANIGTIDIVDIQQKKVIRQLYTDDPEALNTAKDPNNPSIVFPNVVGITWSPDGRYIAASYARSSKVFVWDLQAKNAKVVHGLTIQSAIFPQNSSVTGGTNTINDLSWSPDGHYLAAGFDDHSITIWRVDAEKSAAQASQTHLVL